ncbi:MAG: MerR family transcriptional regulator [Chitinophagaceae bacterium]
MNFIQIVHNNSRLVYDVYGHRTFTDMGKSLPQITFDFISTEESETVQTKEPHSIKKEKPLAALKETEIIMKKEKKVSVSPGSKRGRRSLKEIALTADLINIPPDDILFQKQYYSIGDVAVMFRENQSLIRYWETEFDILQPRKNRKGDRFFRPVDIKNLVLIYDLLRRRKFTIEGAKEYLKNNKKAEEKFAMMQSLEKVKGFLLELKANL